LAARSDESASVSAQQAATAAGIPSKNEM